MTCRVGVGDFCSGQSHISTGSLAAYTNPDVTLVIQVSPSASWIPVAVLGSGSKWGIAQCAVSRQHSITAFLVSHNIVRRLRRCPFCTVTAVFPAHYRVPFCYRNYPRLRPLLPPTAPAPLPLSSHAARLLVSARSGKAVHAVVPW